MIGHSPPLRVRGMTLPDQCDAGFSSFLRTSSRLKEGRSLARREFFQGSQEFPHVLLRRHKQEDPTNPPVLVRIRVMVRLFERVHSQIEQFWRPQREVGISPDGLAFGPLFHENHFPAVCTSTPELGRRR